MEPEVKNWKKVALNRDKWAELIRKARGPPGAVKPMMMMMMEPESSSILLVKHVILMSFYLFLSSFGPFHMLTIYFCNNHSNLILLTKLCHG